MNVSFVIECTYCRVVLNKPPEVYATHTIRDSDGIVLCPELQKVECKYCQASGIEAHDKYFCTQVLNADSTLKKIAKPLETYLNHRKSVPLSSRRSNYGGRLTRYFHNKSSRPQ